MADTQSLIDEASADPSLVDAPGPHRDAVEAVVAELNAGTLRVALPDEAAEDGWRINRFAQAAINLFFRIRPMAEIRGGDLAWYDKIPPRTDFAAEGVRAVPTALVRYGAHVEPGAVLMPSFVNIGARVGAGSMIDTWATVGSCAQVGRNVHVAGGVGIGGVLEPPGARPVIIEDGVFLGSRVIVVEGVLVGEEAVIGAGVVLTASTPIIDVTGAQPKTLHGSVPARAVVIPGTRTKRFPAGDFDLPCALIVGQRKASTDRKTSLNAALRDHGLGG